MALNGQKPNTIVQKLQVHQTQQHKKKKPFLLDPLYCSEEHWEEEEQDCSAEAKEVSFHGFFLKSRPRFLLEQDLLWDEEELSTLFAKEELNHLCAVIRTDPSVAEARREAAEWILKTNAHYSFSALTAVLAVNYLDRFLSSCFSFQREKPWMTQLAAVACLSIAAKVEETEVPLLLDLQVEESRFVFEARTIQRMEILVLSTLQWKMNPVTPLSFLDYITRRLGLKDHLCWEFLRRCELIVLSVITDTRFMGYLPSVMATATMLRVVNCVEPCLQAEYHTQLLGILGMDHKEKVDDCCKLVLEVSLGKVCKKRKFGSKYSIPGSPNGVMDVSFSSDRSNDSWAVTLSVSSSPEPISKKSRTSDDHEEEELLLHTLSPPY